MSAFLRVGFLAGAFCAAVLTVPMAVAQISTETTRPQARELFNRLLGDAGNLDLNYQYAQSLIQEGSYEAAAGALERMLLLEDNPAVRLELGVIYYRMGSYALATSYFDQVSQDPNAPGDVRAKATQYGNEARARLQRNRFSGSLTAGLRLQTNANEGTGNDRVVFGNVSVVRPDVLKPRKDGTLFGAGDIEHIFDMEDGLGTEWVSTGLAYSGWNSSLNDQDLALFEITTGPTMKPALTALPGLRVRPYLALGMSALDGEHYNTSYGPGIGFKYDPTAKLALSANYELRFIDTRNVAGLTTANQFSGNEHVLRLAAIHELDSVSSLLGQVNFRAADTEREFFDFASFQAQVIYRRLYPVAEALRLPGSGERWTASFLIGYEGRSYDAADPAIDRTNSRSDNTLSLGATNRIPFANGWSVYQQVQYDWTSSNIKNYDSKNLSGILGVTRAF